MTEDASALGRPAAPGHLGATLRNLIVSPRSAFQAAVRNSERRARVGSTPAEGGAPYVIAAIGGAGAMTAWLKLGGLIGGRQVTAEDYRWNLLVAALLAGALCAALAQAAWGALGSMITRRLGSDTNSANLRMVWGLASFPYSVALLLVPLDLLVVGPATFTTERLTDPVSTLWAAISISLTVSAALYSAFLFVRGIQVVTGLNLWRSLVATLVAALGTAAVLFALGALASVIAR